MFESFNLQVVSQMADNQDVDAIEYLQSWIQTVPTNDLDGACKMLHGEIRNLYSKNLSIVNRMVALDVLRTGVRQVSETFGSSLLEQGLSLNKSMNTSSILIQSLHAMLMDSYKQCVVSLQNMQVDTGIQMVQAIHRSLSEALALLLFKYQLYNDVSDELWGGINHLYELAEKLELQSIRLEDGTGEGAKPLSIRQLMIQIQLLALAQPYALQRKELALVGRSLKNWSDKVYLDPTHKEESLFQIDLHSNKPAGYLTDNFEIDGVCYIDVSELVGDLADACQRGIANPSFGLDKNMDSHLIEHLCHCWGKHLKRQFYRSQTATPVSVCIGMFASHSCTRNQRNFTELYKPIRLESPRNTRLEEQLEADYPSYSMSLNNIGFGGLCLSYKTRLPECVKIGELISVCFHQHETCLLGVVCWVRIHSNKSVKIGVRVLSSDLDAGFILSSKLTHSRQSPIPAIRLVSMDCKHPDRVITPSGFIKKESLVEAYFLDKKGSFYLQEYECSSKDTKFDIFYLQRPKKDNNSLKMI